MTSLRNAYFGDKSKPFNVKININCLQKAYDRGRLRPRCSSTAWPPFMATLDLPGCKARPDSVHVSTRLASTARAECSQLQGNSTSSNSTGG
ncbi:hypothetical protein TGVAND_286595 [Toxoplasma gondii VAND]|uniref:Uncharacterized protein n=1 Tax=Toxoplasma gondii VAND TaxID=933077 RepID=A0A086Q754_TOXGO|nr:hypothetical protein TGVAND_286595 [Toxoplasma gondii VAND]